MGSRAIRKSQTPFNPRSRSTFISVPENSPNDRRARVQISSRSGATTNSDRAFSLLLPCDKSNPSSILARKAGSMEAAGQLV